MGSPQIPSGQLAEGKSVDKAEAQAVLDKYEEERLKRVRPDGMNQYIVTPVSREYEGFYKDTWANDTVPDPGVNCLVDGARCDFLIVGAGYGGLLSAARLIQAGVDVKDIRLVDSAGGFGGTWWYNRYPGLMCDVESYIYMPLLEEIGYMPKHKYSYGPELRKYAENIAEHYDLKNKALFQSRVINMDWADKQKEWVTTIKSTRQGDHGKVINVRSRFIILAGTSIDWPKLPRLKGFSSFKGHSFHTSRWDWAYTGGSEENPEMKNLKDKTVGIIGTGATAIQIVPQLAKWAKRLYVFQRTPSAVDVRNQQETDKQWWNKEIRGKEGWQQERRTNFSGFMNNTETQPETDMVNDGWTKFQAYAGVAGNERVPQSNEEVEPYLEMMKNLDLPRQIQVRERVDAVVENKETAEKLKAWYPGWCKRPCFHDDYLPSFNLPNVTLVDTDGRGLDIIHENGPYFDGKEYPVDVLVLSTGYDLPIGATPASRLHIDCKGANGETFDSKWKNGMRSLHGVQTNGFPNLFWLGLSQTGATPNQVAMIDELSRHIAFIITEATRKHGTRSLTIQPTVEAEEDWTERVVTGALVFATMGVCPPSYFNAEGDVFRMIEQGEDVQKKLTAASFWPKGLNDFTRVVNDWRTGSPLEGLDIERVSSPSKL